MTTRKFKKLLDQHGYKIRTIHAEPNFPGFGIFVTWENGESTLLKSYLGFYKSRYAVKKVAYWGNVFVQARRGKSII